MPGTFQRVGTEQHQTRHVVVLLYSKEVVEGKTDINHRNPFIETSVQGGTTWMMGRGA